LPQGGVGRGRAAAEERGACVVFEGDEQVGEVFGLKETPEGPDDSEFRCDVGGGAGCGGVERLDGEDAEVVVMEGYGGTGGGVLLHAGDIRELAQGGSVVEGALRGREPVVAGGPLCEGSAVGVE